MHIYTRYPREPAMATSKIYPPWQLLFFNKLHYSKKHSNTHFFILISIFRLIATRAPDALQEAAHLNLTVISRQ